MGDEILSKIKVRNLVNQIWAGESVPPDKRTGEDVKEFESRIYEYVNYYNKSWRRLSTGNWKAM